MTKKITNFIKKFFSHFTFHISRHRAFTLAEVLITLGIIGVVAAMTIPNLVKDYQKTQYVTALKKAYATTNQALKQMAADSGCIDDLKCTGLFDSSVTGQHNILGKALVKYFSVSQNCNTATNQHCFADVTNAYYDGTYTGANPTYDVYGGYKFVTADGTSFYIENYKNNCLTDGTNGSTDYSTGRTGNMKQTCGAIYIDVNGLKKPNAFGRDTFVFFITNGKGVTLYPLGGSDDGWNTGSVGDWWWQDGSGNLKRCYPSLKNGYYCAGRVMEQGWQMNY